MEGVEGNGPAAPAGKPHGQHDAKDLVLGLIAVAFVRVTAALPISLVRAITTSLGRIALRLVPRLWRVGMQNLDLAYGETLSRAEKWRILRGAMDNMAIVAAEFSRLPRLCGQASAAWVEVEGIERVDRLRGSVLISAHLSNWEFMAAAMARHDMHIAEIVRPLRDPRLNNVVDTTRRGGGFDTIPKVDAGREVLRRIGAGEHVGVLVDQAPRENAVPVTFFGQPCWATIAPVMIALRSKAPIHLAVMHRKPDGRYVLRVSPAIDLKREHDFQHDLVENSQRIQDMVEAAVREHPDQWLWFHRRWKKRPRLEQEWAERVKRNQER